LRRKGDLPLSGGYRRAKKEGEAAPLSSTSQGVGEKTTIVKSIRSGKKNPNKKLTIVSVWGAQEQGLR